MIENQVVPSIEISPRVYSLCYKVEHIRHLDGNRTDFSWTGNILSISYTYEDAISELHETLIKQANSDNVHIKLGCVKIVDYTSETLVSLFNEAYEKYGTPEFEETEEDE